VNTRFKDTALAALARLGPGARLRAVANRSEKHASAKRARGLMREREDEKRRSGGRRTATGRPPR